MMSPCLPVSRLPVDAAAAAVVRIVVFFFPGGAADAASWAGSGCGSMVPPSTTIQAVPCSPPDGPPQTTPSRIWLVSLSLPLPLGTPRFDSLNMPASWPVRRRESVEQS